MINTLPKHLAERILSMMNKKNVARTSCVSKSMKNTTKTYRATLKSQQIYREKRKQKRAKEQLKVSKDIIQLGKQMMNHFRRHRNFPHPDNMNHELNNLIRNGNEQKLLTDRQKIIVKDILLTYLIYYDFNAQPPNMKLLRMKLSDKSKTELEDIYSQNMEIYTNNFAH
jgi:hypothetical protein